MSVTTLTLLFGHCIEVGKENTYIDVLVENARKRFRNFICQDTFGWKTERTGQFAYCISVRALAHERADAVLGFLGIGVPQAVLARVLTDDIRVEGLIHLLPQQKVRVEARYPPLPPLARFFARPNLIRGVAKRTIIMSAREAFGPKFQLTAE